MDIDSARLLYAQDDRKDGLGAAHSMFFSAKTERRGPKTGAGRSPDSEGIAMGQERESGLAAAEISGQLHFSAYVDENTRGFGLLAAGP